MIYLDHAATSVPRCADAVAASARASDLGTPGRGQHSLQAAAAAAVEGARDSVARLLPTGYTIAFTAGATASISQAVFGLRPSPRVVACDPLAHNAVARAVGRLSQRGVELWLLPHDPITGRIDIGRIAGEWRDGTTLVALTHGSNVSGLVQPVAEISSVARARGARVLVDAAQTAGLLVPLPVGDADMIAFSSHKGLASLPGIGVLAVRGDVELEPLVVGGTGFDSWAREMPAELPARLEAGTPNVPGIAAIGAASVAALNVNVDWRARTKALVESIERAGLQATCAGDLPIALVRGMPRMAASELEEALDRAYGIVTRAGTHCAPTAHTLLGTGREGALRVSMGKGTTDGDLTALTTALREIRRGLEAA